jgi:hypothetical protein
MAISEGLADFQVFQLKVITRISDLFLARFLPRLRSSREIFAQDGG